jgi:hypothetical protein
MIGSVGNVGVGYGGRVGRSASTFATALAVWGGGMGAWAYSRGGYQAVSLPGQWLGRQPAANQALLIPLFLLAVGSSGLIVNRLGAVFLRFVEGDWPRWTVPLYHRLVARRTRRALAEDRAWEQARRDFDSSPTLTARLVVTRNVLDRRRRYRPAYPNFLLPTKVGNILRAAEIRVAEKYGLANDVVWPRLLLVLPEPAASRVTAARRAVDRAVATVVWGLLFCAFAALTPLVVPIGLAVAAIALLVAVPARVRDLTDLMESVYDLHRNELYRQLRWPLPMNPGEDRAQGVRVSDYLRNGLNAAEPLFTTPS